MPFAPIRIVGTTCWYQKRYFIECHRFDEIRRWCYLRYKLDNVWRYTDLRYEHWVELCKNWPCPCWLYKDLSVNNEGDYDQKATPTGDVVADISAFIEQAVDGAVKVGPFSDSSGPSSYGVNPYVCELSRRVKSGEIDTFTVLYKETFRDTRKTQRDWYIIVSTRIESLLYLPVDVTFSTSNEKFSRGSFTISNRLINRVAMGGVGMDNGVYDQGNNIVLHSLVAGEVRPSRREFFPPVDDHTVTPE